MATSGAVVLAAGGSTRMKSATPKALHKICGREMVKLVIDAAGRAGFDETVVVGPRNCRGLVEILGNGVRYAEQPQPLGSGNALLQARRALSGASNVAVLYCDTPLILPETLERMTQLHHEKGACVTFLTAEYPNPRGYGRVLRSDSGEVTGIMEQCDADEAALSISEVNVGAYIFQAPWVWDRLEDLAPSSNRESFLTDLIAAAVREGLLVETVEASESDEVLGVNTRVQLAEAERALQRRIGEHWMLSGVTIQDPASTYIEAAVEIGQDTTLLPNTRLAGATRVGRNCRIGPNSDVSDSRVGDECEIAASVVEGSTLERGVSVGPFSHVRPGTLLRENVYIGNFVEVKNSRLGPETKSGHFSYIGDAELGIGVNIGAGTVTCNYDGDKKNRTSIGDGAFIGSDTMLVAPVDVGPRSSTGAGAVVTRDVPPDSIAVGAPARSAPKRRPPERRSEDRKKQ